MAVEIDQLLADWKNKVKIASQNLLELQELPTYQRLCGSPGFPGVHLTGITAARVTPALELVNKLFQYFDLLVQTVDQATKLRQQLPHFLPKEQKIGFLMVGEQKIDEIKKLLTGASIELPAVQTPLAQRGLLTGAQKVNAITPALLVEVMTDAFSVARDTLLAVEAAWTNLDLILTNAETQIRSLQQLAESLDRGSLNELVQVRETIASLRDRIEQDPLGVSENVEQQIQPLLTQVKVALEQKAKQQAQIRDKFAIAHDLLQQLEELNSKSIAAFAESQEKVVDHSMLATPLTQVQIDALSQWLTRLETKLAEGLVNPVMVGLENLTIKTREYIALEKQTHIANSAPLETRRELRGRLDALKAKALARGLIEDVILAELAEKAKQLLHTRPTPLDKAAELVSKYEKRLNSK
ncbi:hypothetical protein FNW02_26790 [Komarekiella sp. 'clone 1']|uniref:Uncharacterized protein n=1 Tax=Komarekiella delphini-convector SJRDD-AB1 TaxID=2593771 RepID=A0AA40VTP9_9NOST|nr:hypothetical protein [Komarekiella delphini-convector]MBD6619337.1 hypothetical protein [Komarekiella delphini-convector SJRDD-AB1]